MRIADKKNRIREIVELLNVPVDLKTPEGVSSRLLRQLWENTIGLYFESRGQPVPPFAPVSPYWKLIGFQRETPLTDFRGGGILSLMHLVAFVSTFPRFVLALMSIPSDLKYLSKPDQSDGPRLPLAIACINLSILLVKQLGFFALSSASLDLASLSHKPFWSLADAPRFLDQVRFPRFPHPRFS